MYSQFILYEASEVSLKPVEWSLVILVTVVTASMGLDGYYPNMEQAAARPIQKYRTKQVLEHPGEEGQFAAHMAICGCQRAEGSIPSGELAILSAIQTRAN